MSQTTGSGQKMGKISGSHCLVLGCRNRQLLNQTNTRSYFRFPRDADLCKKWVDFCNRPELYKKYDENGPEYLYKSSRICSDHFQPNDFNNPNLYSQGLKKGSIPTVNPASKEPKSASSPLNGVTTTVTTGNGAGGGGGGGSGSSNGTGSPIDEKLLTAAVASMAGGGTPLPAEHLSLFYAAAIAAAAQAQAAASNHHSVPLNLKRTAPAPAAPTTNNNNNGSSNLQSSGVTSATSSTTTTSTTPPAATGGGGGGGSGPVSAKRNRAVPPLATPTGALANLIQRQQQIKEQQRKAAAAAAASHASAKQLSITPTTGGAAGVTTSATRAPHSLVPIGNTTTTTTPPSNGANGGGAAAAVVPPSSKRLTLNNNNNNVSNNNHQHQSQKPSLLGKRSSREDYNGSGSDYGINMMDIDTLSGAESSEGDSSNGPTSADEEYAAYRRQLKKVTRKVEEVIPLALKSQLTVTPANLGNSVSSTTTTTALSPTIGRSATTTINNNNIHNVNANGGGAVSPDDKDGGQVDYKQKYELTLKELFACRKIVKNQNKAMKQLQGEIDFLNLLLKEK